MMSVYRRELSGLFSRVTGGLFLLLTTSAMGIGTYYFCVQTGYRTVHQASSAALSAYLVLIPILMMDMFDKEKRFGTYRLLLSSPMRISSVVLGKYFAYLTLYLIACLISCVFPAVLCALTDAPWAENAVSMAALFATGAFLMAVMTHIASAAPNRWVALLAGLAGMAALWFLKDIAGGIQSGERLSLMLFLVLVLAALYLFTKNVVWTLAIGVVVEIPVIVEQLLGGSAVKLLYGKALTAISPFVRISGYAYGIFDIGALIYFATGIALLLMLSVAAAERPGFGLRRAAK